MCRDPRWGRCYESYSEDPKIVKQMIDLIYGLQGYPSDANKGRPSVAKYARKRIFTGVSFPKIGFCFQTPKFHFLFCLRDKIVACAKHYVGDGGTGNGINENTVVDWHGLISIHMPAYYHAIIKGVLTFMISYSSWNGMKMHTNRELVTDFLKGTLRFRVCIDCHWSSNL